MSKWLWLDAAKMGDGCLSVGPRQRGTEGVSSAVRATLVSDVPRDTGSVSWNS